MHLSGTYKQGSRLSSWLPKIPNFSKETSQLYKVKFYINRCLMI